jgi:FkbM family methyltransferase
MRHSGFSPRSIVDVGASNGQWTRQCLTVYPEPGYFLVDPLDENKQHLRALGQEYFNVRSWTGALGASDGELLIHASGDQSSMLSSAEFAGQARVVPVRTLDSFLDTGDLEAPLLLKADIQGFELEMLKGAERTLLMTEVLLLETSIIRLYEGCPLIHDVIQYVCSRGFRVFDFCSYVQRPGDLRLAQMDVAFVSEGSSLLGAEGWFGGCPR